MIVQILIALLVVGVALYLIGLIPMDQKILMAIRAVVLLILVLWILQVFGLFGPVAPVRVR